MMILSRLIPWDSLEVEFADLYQSNSGGQPPKPILSQTMEKILSLTVFVAVKSEAVKVNDLKKVIVDTTVMPKNIEFPTDSKLYDKARERLVKLAAKNGMLCDKTTTSSPKLFCVKSQAIFTANR